MKNVRVLKETFLFAFEMNPTADLLLTVGLGLWRITLTVMNEPASYRNLR